MSQYAVPSDCHKPVKLGFPSGIRGMRGAAAGAVVWPRVWPCMDMTKSNVRSVIETTNKTFNRSDMDPIPPKMPLCGPVRYGFVSFSADDPANTFLPLANVTVDASLPTFSGRL